MSERENLGAGIYAALSAFVVLIGLIGAFVLPPSLVSSISLKRRATFHAQFREADPLKKSQQIPVWIAEGDLPYAPGMGHGSQSDFGALLHGARAQRVQIGLRPKAYSKPDAVDWTWNAGFIRQRPLRLAALPDESGVPGVVPGCAHWVSGKGFSLRNQE